MQILLAFLLLANLLCFVTSKDPTGPLDPICIDSALPEPPCCGASSLAARLRGPDQQPVNKTAGEFPWFLSVHGGIGLGSLINSQWVITAAHVVNSRNKPKSVTVSTTMGLPPNENHRYKVDAIITHPLYNYEWRIAYDVSLLHLAEPMELTEFRQPICLPLDPALKRRNFYGANVTFAGWGKFHRTKVDTKIRSNYLASSPKITTPDIATGGDSGSGMIIRLDDNPKKIMTHYLLGVVSHGGGFCMLVRTTAIIEWIKAVIQTYDSDKPYAVGWNRDKA